MGEPDDREWLARVAPLLREARTEAGISLEEAAERTKLSVRQLTALEQGDWSRLPAPAYVRGFVKSYARFLRIPDPIPRPAAEEPAAADERDKRPLPRKWRARTFLTPLLLLGGIILLSLFWDDTPPPPPSRQTEAPPAGSTAPLFPTRSSVAPTPSPPAPPVPKDADATDGEAAEPAGLILKLTATDACWLQVTIDDSLSRQYDLVAGDTIEWKADRTITIDVGNAGGVEGELNGTPLPPFGARGEVVHRTYRADSFEPASHPPDDRQQ